MRLIKLLILLGAALLSQTPVSRAAQIPATPIREHVFYFTATNPASISRPHELVSLYLKKVEAKYQSFNDRAFVVKCAGKEVPSQLDEGRPANIDTRVPILTSFAPHEKKDFSVTWIYDTVMSRRYPKLTQAALGTKADYTKVNGYYTGGKFVDADSATVPPDHFAHHALQRIDGPCWEADKIAFRFYPESRNRNDILGKRIDGLVLRTQGGYLIYYFGAAWQEEPDGIKNGSEFKGSLERAIVELNNPIEVSL